MSEDQDKDSKTEEPTEKKIKDAVQKGQTAVSREIPLLVSLSCFTVYFIFSGPGLAGSLSSFLEGFFENAGQIDLINQTDASNLFTRVSSQLVFLLAPLICMLLAGGILASVVQNEPRAVLDRIMPKASRISLKKGWERVFGKQGMVEFLKSLSKLSFAATVVLVAMYSAPEDLIAGMFRDPRTTGNVVAGIVTSLLVSVCLAMTVIAIADLIWSRFSWRQGLRMTRKEVTDELKQAEGDPILKARMRSIARDRSRQRMMDAVPTATLLIANPTHIAIALRFDETRDEAPVVVAKGQDLIALRIREIAEANGIPVFERVELARALHKAVEIDQTIPPDFYVAVAELIKIIYRRTSQ